MTNQLVFKSFPRTIGDLVARTEQHCIGDGQVAVEFLDHEGGFLGELFLENGTRCSEEEFEFSQENFAKKEAALFSTLLPLDERINRRGRLV